MRKNVKPRIVGIGSTFRGLTFFRLVEIRSKSRNPEASEDSCMNPLPVQVATVHNHKHFDKNFLGNPVRSTL